MQFILQCQEKNSNMWHDDEWFETYEEAKKVKRRIVFKVPTSKWRIVKLVG